VAVSTGFLPAATALAAARPVVLEQVGPVVVVPALAQAAVAVAPAQAAVAVAPAQAAVAVAPARAAVAPARAAVAVLAVVVPEAADPGAAAPQEAVGPAVVVDLVVVAALAAVPVDDTRSSERMTHHMDSPVKARRTYRRVFARTAVFATILVLGLLGLGLIFPPEATQPYALSAGGGGETSYGLRDLQLLVMIASFFVAIASCVGLCITGIIKWLDTRSARKEARTYSTSVDRRAAALTTEPANERLRAPRAVTTSSIEEAPAQKT
jgi:hypothetical protein